VPFIFPDISRLGSSRRSLRELRFAACSPLYGARATRCPVRGPGVGLSLLARAILRQAEETDIPRFIWMVDAEHTRMHRFLSSRFASIIDTEDALLESAKQL